MQWVLLLAGYCFCTVAAIMATYKTEYGRALLAKAVPKHAKGLCYVGMLLCVFIGGAGVAMFGILLMLFTKIYGPPLLFGSFYFVVLALGVGYAVNIWRMRTRKKSLFFLAAAIPIFTFFLSSWRVNSIGLLDMFLWPCAGAVAFACIKAAVEKLQGEEMMAALVYAYIPVVTAVPFALWGAVLLYFNIT